MSEKISELPSFSGGSLPSTAKIPVSIDGVTYKAQPSTFGGGGGSVGNLQQVTDNGKTITDGTNQTTLDEFGIGNTNGNNSTQLEADGVHSTNVNAEQIGYSLADFNFYWAKKVISTYKLIKLKVTNVLHNVTFEMPDKPDGTYTLATHDEIPTQLSQLSDDSTHRTVTDTEKSTWNGKQSALGYTPENSANKGANNGYAGLDSTGKVPSSQLPSYVDDVLEFANLASFPITGESGKIYIALDTNLEYRWSGTIYVNIAKGDVQSVNTKTGAVVLNTDDIAESGTPTNKWWTNARTIASTLTGFTSGAGTVTSSDSVLTALQKLAGNISALVTGVSSVNTKTGAVTLTTADIADSTNKRYQTDNQNTYNDATSSIQTQLNGKLANTSSAILTALGWYNYKNTTPSSTLTGTLTETQLLQITIPANTFGANDFLKIPSLTLIKSGTNAGAAIRVKLSTSSTMPSGTTGQIATYSISATVLYSKISRIFSIASGNILGFNFLGTSISDNTTSTSTISSQAFDRTVTQYLYVSATLSNTSDSIYLNDIQVTNM